MSAEQHRLIGRVANLEGDKRMVMLIEPGNLLQGSEMQAMREIDAPAAAPEPVYARAA
jgi:purine-binding chemotaxis protein CheW